MSVVNQMLRDLDRRQARDGDRVFGQHVRPVRARWLPFVIALAAFALVGGAAYVGYGMLGGTHGPQTAVAQVPAQAANPIASPSSPADPKPAQVSAEQSPRIATQSPPAAPPVAAAAEPQRPAVSEASAAAKPARSAPSSVKSELPTPPKREVAVVSPRPPVATPEPAATSPAQPEGASPKIDKRFRETSTRTADSEFRRAAALLEQGRIEDSRAALQATLALDARHEAARQTLAALLIEGGQLEEAEAALAEGLRLNPAQSNFTLVLARLKLDRRDAPGALALLREHAGAAASNPQYRAFAAAILQRLGRHAEAIDEYQAALKLAPGVGVWWIGLGLSQEAVDRPADAADAYRRAKASGALNAELAEFVDRKLKTAR